MGKRRRRSSRESFWTQEYGGMPVWGLSAAVVFLIVAASVAIPAALNQPERSQAVAPVAPIPAPTTTTAPSNVTFPEAWERLDQEDRPFTVAVVGDSTANGEDEWANLVFQEIATDAGRPLQQRVWDVDSASYIEELNGNEDASGEPIVLWNASASGKDGAYSLEHLTGMVPEAPDLVILNHGHNAYQTPRTLVSQLGKLRSALSKKYPETGFASVIQNPRVDDAADAFDAAIASQRAWLESNPDVLAIDVYAAYTAAGDVPSLLNSDGFHPNREGSEIAAAAVSSALSAQ